MSARDEVLARIRSATRTPSAPLPDSVGIPSSPAPTSAPSPATAAADRVRGASETADTRTASTAAGPVELFVERVRDYRARVFEVAADEAPGVVASLVAEDEPAATARGGTPLVIAPGGLGDALLAELPPVRLSRDEPPLSVEALDAAAAVITGCAVGIAETGTIVLDGSADQGRRALTLVPDHHIVVIRSDQVVGDVRDAVALLQPTRALTFISGPSATSDIELSRVEGVHGPRRLDVLVVRS